MKIAIPLLIAILCMTTVYAVFYMEKQVTMKATIETSGAFTVTPMTYDFGIFPSTGDKIVNLDNMNLTNTGNVPLKIVFFVTGIGTWNNTSQQYEVFKSGSLLWAFYLRYKPNTEWVNYNAKVSSSPTIFNLGIGESFLISQTILQKETVFAVPSDSLNFVLHFEAYDTYP